MVIQKDELNKLRPLNVLIIGDFFLDKYVNGDVSRISPEAPVPVLKVKSIEYRLGGAGNVANNIAALGGIPRIVACIGADDEGAILLAELKNHSCDIQYVTVCDEVSTICKTRIVSKNQQLLRVDREEEQFVSHEFIEDVRGKIKRIFEDIDIVILSDYGKGNVTGEFAQLIIRYANAKNIPVVVDPKGNDYTKYSGATLCTPNINEFCAATNCTICAEDDIWVNAQKIIEMGIDNVLLTRSENGLSLITRNEKNDYPVETKEVIDVTGAGDTVVALMAMGIGGGLTLEESCMLANQGASIVISKFGTATVSLEELYRQNAHNNLCGKIVSVSEIEIIKKLLEVEHKTIVFTNGCFDLLHSGHLDSLQKAKGFGDILIVGLNSDESVKRLKGFSRPIIDEINRAIMLSGLECVDYVIIYEDDTPQKIIEILEPNVLVKGSEWKGKKVVGEDFVKAKNGRIEYVDMRQGFSTSAIIDKIKRA